MKPLFAFLALCAAPLFANAQDDPWAVYRAVAQLSVDEGRSISQGSGTLVATYKDKGLILSCRHVCMKNGNTVEVTWFGDPAGCWPDGPTTTIGRVEYVFQGRGLDTDLALVVAPFPSGIKPVKVAKFSPSKGPWKSAGYRGGKFLVAEASTAYMNDEGLVMVNSAYRQGMSGGACFDGAGRVVGVVVASDMDSTGVSVGGPNLHTMLDNFRFTGVLERGKPLVPMSVETLERESLFADPIEEAGPFGIFPRDGRGSAPDSPGPQTPTDPPKFVFPGDELEPTPADPPDDLPQPTQPVLPDEPGKKPRIDPEKLQMWIQLAIMIISMLSGAGLLGGIQFASKKGLFKRDRAKAVASVMQKVFEKSDLAALEKQQVIAKVYELLDSDDKTSHF